MMDYNTVIEHICHYKKRLMKPTNEMKTCHYLSRLKALPVTVDHLQATGIGITVNSLRKTDGIVGEKARSLVKRWKRMVEEDDQLGKYSREDSDDFKEEKKDSSEESNDEKLNGHYSDGDHEPVGHSRLNHSENHAKHYSVQENGSDSEVDSAKAQEENFGEYSSHYDEMDDDEGEMEIDIDKYEIEPDSVQDEEPEEKNSTKVSDKKRHKHKHKSSRSSEKQKSKEKCEKKTDCKSKIPTKVKESLQMKPKRSYDEDQPAKKSKKDKDRHSTKLKEDISSCSFGDALGSTDTYSPSKKPSKSKKHKKSVTSSKDPVKIPESSNNINLSLPKIDPDYKPFHYPVIESVVKPKAKLPSDEEALNMLMTTKRARTKVYSGVKNCGWIVVPSLYELCCKILYDNFSALEFTGGVPFDVLRPVLEKVSPEQLEVFEYYNAYLVEETDPLWEKHCHKFIRNKSRQELESWREFYFRCQDEEEAKLKLLKENYLQSKAQAIPVRQTKLAYVDTFAKPPRSIARKQEKFGTYDAGRPKPLSSCASSSSASSSTCIAPIKVPPPPQSKSLQAPRKPKVAPLMQKALKFMKNRFKK